MTYTALHEVFGGGVDRSASAEILGPFSGAPGCRRFYLLRTTDNATAILPDADDVREGEYCAISAVGTGNVEVFSAAGGSVATLTPGQTGQFFLVSRPDGTWASRIKSTRGLSAALVTDRDEFEFTLPNLVRANLRFYVENVFGYLGQKPAIVRATLPAGGLIGSDTVGSPGLYTGTWPAGSVIVLTLEAGSWIVGRGGAGGRGGGGGLLSTAGGPGGDALSIECNTVLVNRGKIQGGGGGGAGSAASGSIPGGGGGGGAGWTTSAGGAGGITSGPAGQPGGLEQPGAGGLPLLGNAAGNGGAPGAAGASAGAQPGGAAGNAIVRASAFTLTKIVAGTIDGAEVTV